jgi:hypothetical protein
MGPLSLPYGLGLGSEVSEANITVVSFLLWGAATDFLVISTTDIGTGSGRIKLS